VAGLQLVGGTSAQIKSMHMFGQAMGMAFQIVDDLLDVEGDATALGKQIGMDAAHGKLTWPAIHGMDAAHAAADAYSRAAQEALESFGTRAVFLRELAARMNRRRQ
ncbi:MAG: polyprenyl synthetase family protein, partial [Clostridia bacterium]